VDVLTWRSKSGRITAQIRDLCAILSGLVVAQDYKAGQQLVADREFGDNAAFFQVGGGAAWGMCHCCTGAALRAAARACCASAAADRDARRTAN
jgi:hypothetical protein